MNKLLSLIAALRKSNGEKLFLSLIERSIVKFEFFLSPKDKILDFGSGTCMFTKVLQQKGYSVTPVDIDNKSYYPSITPVIYDGARLPFKTGSFDICILLAVLHHTKNPEAILQEAVRVSKKIILLEDIYSNRLQKYYTFFIDSLLNKEFIGHPHTNKTGNEWEELFKKLGLRIEKKEYSKAYGYLQNGTYYLVNSESAF